MKPLTPKQREALDIPGRWTWSPEEQALREKLSRARRKRDKWDRRVTKLIDELDNLD